MRNIIGFFLMLMLVVLTTPATNAKQINLLVQGEATCDALPHPGYIPVQYVEVLTSTLIPSDQFAGYRVTVSNEQMEVREYFSHVPFESGDILTLCKRGRNHKLAPLVVL